MSLSDSIGLLVIAHGTRSAAGVEQFLALARSIGQRIAPLPVEPAFLELAKPDIDDAVDHLLARDINCLVTMPLLLFAAGHIKRDIPRVVSAALARRGKQQIEQIQAGHLGCHPAIVELSQRRMEEGILTGSLSEGSSLETAHGNPSLTLRVSVLARPATCLLLVARGSRDDSATAEMYDFARFRQEDLISRLPPGNAVAGGSRLREARDDSDPAAQRGRASRYCGPSVDPRTEIEVAFLAMACPLLSEKLADVAAKGYSRVIVQPHLLFDGELIDSIGTQVAAMASNHPQTDWLVAPPLADRAGFVTPGTPLLQKVIFARLDAAGIHVVAPPGDD